MIVGLTGQSGSGKTHITKLFSDNGYYVINADETVHELYKTTEYINKIRSIFPNAIVDDRIDRPTLGKIVFSNRDNLVLLNNTILPMITSDIKAIIRKVDKDRVLIDAPTLFESGLNSICDKTVAVVASEEIRIKRIIERDSICFEEAEKRTKNQKEKAFFDKNCDYVLENNTSIESIEKETLKVIKEIG